MIKAQNSKFCDHVRTSKYKNIFAKEYTPNWCEEVFVIKRVKYTVSWTYAINDLTGEEITGRFYEKELQKTNQQAFGMENVIKENVISCMWNGKVMMVYLIVGLIKNN